MVTVYNHMDVQPAQEPEWQRDPFAFQNEGGIYRGRGATDDKGPALSALFGARFRDRSRRADRYSLSSGSLKKRSAVLILPPVSNSEPRFPAPILWWSPIRFGLRKGVQPCRMDCED